MHLYLSIYSYTALVKLFAYFYQGVQSEYEKNQSWTDVYKFLIHDSHFSVLENFALQRLMNHAWKNYYDNGKGQPNPCEVYYNKFTEEKEGYLFDCEKIFSWMKHMTKRYLPDKAKKWDVFREFETRYLNHYAEFETFFNDAMSYIEQEKKNEVFADSKKESDTQEQDMSTEELIDPQTIDEFCKFQELYQSFQTLADEIQTLDNTCSHAYLQPVCELLDKFHTAFAEVPLLTKNHDWKHFATYHLPMLLSGMRTYITLCKHDVLKAEDRSLMEETMQNTHKVLLIVRESVFHNDSLAYAVNLETLNKLYGMDGFIGNSLHADQNNHEKEK